MPWPNESASATPPTCASTSAGYSTSAPTPTAGPFTLLSPLTDSTRPRTLTKTRWYPLRQVRRLSAPGDRAVSGVGSQYADASQLGTGWGEVIDVDGISCTAALAGSGAMGVHFANGSRIVDGSVDPRQPEAAVYEPRAWLAAPGWRCGPRTCTAERRREPGWLPHPLGCGSQSRQGGCVR